MGLITIKKRKDFLYAAKSGKKFITSSFILQMVERPKDHRCPIEDIRIGFTATKKIGNAVIRNRAKRRLKEAARLTAAKHGIAGSDYVIIARHKTPDCSFSELKRDMEFAFTRIIRHKSRESKSN